MSSRQVLACALGAALLLLAPRASADKVAVLPFTAPTTLPKPELDQARTWTQQAVTARGHTAPTDSELLTAEMAVKDGVADTSEECTAAGRASGSDWTLMGRVERMDFPAQTAPDGVEEAGYTAYRLELEACRVDSGRVESLTRDVDPEEASAEIGEMIALLLRPEGIGKADIPWKLGQRKRKVKPPPPPPPEKPRPPPPPPPRKYAYAEGHPIAIGASIGVTNALARPDVARGPSWAMPIGAVVGYAFEGLPGLEARGVFTSQVIGPRALEVSGGARYAIPVLPQYRIFVGPELLVGAHVALGADKTTRFLTHGAAFAAIGLGDQVQLEIAGDLAAAFGGTGTLVLGGGTARALVRF